MIIKLIGDDWVPEDNLVMAVVEDERPQSSMAKLQKKLGVKRIEDFKMFVAEGRKCDFSRSLKKDASWKEQGVVQLTTIYFTKKSPPKEVDEPLPLETVDSLGIPVMPVATPPPPPPLPPPPPQPAMPETAAALTAKVLPRPPANTPPPPPPPHPLHASAVLWKESASENAVPEKRSDSEPQRLFGLKTLTPPAKSVQAPAFEEVEVNQPPDEKPILRHDSLMKGSETANRGASLSDLLDKTMSSGVFEKETHSSESSEKKELHRDVFVNEPGNAPVPLTSDHNVIPPNGQRLPSPSVEVKKRDDAAVGESASLKEERQVALSAGAHFSNASLRSNWNTRPHLSIAVTKPPSRTHTPDLQTVHRELQEVSVPVAIEQVTHSLQEPSMTSAQLKMSIPIGQTSFILAEDLQNRSATTTAITDEIVEMPLSHSPKGSAIFAQPPESLEIGGQSFSPSFPQNLVKHATAPFSPSSVANVAPQHVPVAALAEERLLARIHELEQDVARLRSNQLSEFGGLVDDRVRSLAVSQVDLLGRFVQKKRSAAANVVALYEFAHAHVSNVRERTVKIDSFDYLKKSPTEKPLYKYK